MLELLHSLTISSHLVVKSSTAGPDSFHLEALFRNEAWDHMIQPLSDFNENLICETMVSGCRTALDQYKTNVSSDMALLGRKGITEKEAVAAQVWWLVCEHPSLLVRDGVLIDYWTCTCLIRCLQ